MVNFASGWQSIKKQSDRAQEETDTELIAAKPEPTKSPDADKSYFMEDEETSKYREIPGAKGLKKKPGKYGWGWFIFFGMFASYISKNDAFSDHTLSALSNLLPFFSLFLYFGLRSRWIAKWENRWIPGLMVSAPI